ncbi:MAG: hypothetical protein R3345_07415 [Fulvivirga sp.]|nr:hypothetical protein [Fulvivirga sp.]
MMKTQIKTTLVLALTVFASTVFANGVDTYIKVREDKTFSVHRNTGGLLNLTFKDTGDKVLYRATDFSNERFAGYFDLENLPVGTYFLEVEDTEKISTYPVKVERHGLAIDKKNAKHIFKPALNVSDRRVGVSMLNTMNTPLEVAIYNSNKELINIYSIDDKTVNKFFDLSQLGNDVYSFVLKVGGKRFEKTVTIR